MDSNIEQELRKRRCCFTGHRPHKIGMKEETVKELLRKAIKQAIEDEDSDRLESVSYPYPVDATETMLECFDHIYRILPLPQTDPQATTVGDIAEDLWIYSKLNTFLLENDDKEYYKDQQMIIWDSIKKHQKQLLNVLTHEKSAALDSIIEGVHNGEPFDNPELNNFVTDFSIETA